MSKRSDKRKASKRKSSGRVERQSGLRNLRLILWGLVLLTGLGASWLFLASPTGSPQASVAGDLGQGDYRLQTTEGQPFTEASLRGQPSLVFFGFTNCPDVCPTTMGDIMGWTEDLGTDSRKLKVWFITVDPDRDTPKVLRDYIAWIPGASGVAGSSEETDKALKAFKIYARKVPLDGGGYSMDHSASVLVFDAKGRFVNSIPYQTPPETAVAKIRQAMG